MKDLGVADVILNIKLLRYDNGGIILLQSHYENLPQNPMILACFFERIKWLL
jgi:hypothetical protein